MCYFIKKHGFLKERFVTARGAIKANEERAVKGISFKVNFLIILYSYEDKIDLFKFFR